MKAPTCTAVKLELRRAAVTHDLDVAPEHPARVSRAERLHGSFFGCESAGKMDRGSMSSSAVGNFIGCEDSRHEAIPVSRDRRRDTVDVGGVEPEPQYVRHRKMIQPQPD